MISNLGPIRADDDVIYCLQGSLHACKQQLAKLLLDLFEWPWLWREQSLFNTRLVNNGPNQNLCCHSLQSKTSMGTHYMYMATGLQKLDQPSNEHQPPTQNIQATLASEMVRKCPRTGSRFSLPYPQLKAPWCYGPRRIAGDLPFCKWIQAWTFPHEPNEIDFSTLQCTPKAEFRAKQIYNRKERYWTNCLKTTAGYYCQLMQWTHVTTAPGFFSMA